MDIKIFVFLICDNNILFWITLILNNIKKCTANLSWNFVFNNYRITKKLLNFSEFYKEIHKFNTSQECFCIKGL